MDSSNVPGGSTARNDRKAGKPRASHERVLAIARMPGLKATEKVVAMVLAARDGPDLFPAVDTLAEDTAMSVRSVERALAGLRLKKVISNRRRGFGKSSRYEVNYAADPASAPPFPPRCGGNDDRSHFRQRMAERVPPTGGGSISATGWRNVTKGIYIRN